MEETAEQIERAFDKMAAEETRNLCPECGCKMYKNGLNIHDDIGCLWHQFHQQEARERKANGQNVKKRN